MIIEGKAQKKIDNGSTMTTWTLGGKKYNTFDEAYEKFNIGDHVKITTEKKGKYDNITSMVAGSPEDTEKETHEINNGSLGVSESSLVNAKSVVLNKTDKPNSYEFGKAGNRFKIYFNEVDELKARIKELEDAGLTHQEDLEMNPEDFGKGE